MKNRLSLPEDFVERMTSRLKNDSSSFFSSLQTLPPVSVRLHPLKPTDHLKAAGSVPWCSYGIYLQSRPVFTLDPLFHGGTYYVQEAGSMLIEPLLGSLLEELESPVVLDLCAAPGGKSTHLLSMMNGKGLLVCNETVPSRNATLRLNLSKWGYSNTIVTQQDAASIMNSGLKFDVIVVDAPCSGEGLFRKQPSAVQEWSLSQVAHCCQRQTGILNDIVPALKDGGYLLYSTCTYECEENDDQVRRLIEKWGLECVTPPPPDGIEATAFGWQAWPHRVDAEGYYCALLRKKGTLRNSVVSTAKRSQDSVPLPVKSLLRLPESYSFVNREDFIYAYPSGLSFYIDRLAGSGYLRNAGLLMGQMKGKDFIPDTALAMSIEFENNWPVIQAGKEMALQYLKGETVGFESDHDGWHLVSFENHPLGWAKKTGRRWNNYFPKHLRIRMDAAVG